MSPIKPQEQVEQIINFIRTVLQKSGYSKIIVACSGGIDSSVVATLAVKTIGVERVFALLMPYKNLNSEGLKLGKRLTEYLHLPSNHVLSVPIDDAVDAFLAKLSVEEDARIRQGNIMARVRMIVTYDFAKKEKALVAGTENKSEYHLGYFTRYGDEASDFEPIRHLNKAQVYELAKYLNLPSEIQTQQPTAGLWGGQTDESELGFSYKEADEVLDAFYEKKKTTEEIEKAGFPNTRKIIEFAEKNTYKHRVPYVVEEKVD